MAEFRPEKLDPSLAEVIPLHSARKRDLIRGARQMTRTREYGESRIFEAIMQELFMNSQHIKRYVGDPLLLSRSESADVTLARVAEEEREDGMHLFTVIVSPDEYESLTTNLPFSEWHDTESGLSPESLLGRFYRLTLATNYIVETRGYTELDNIVFRGGISLDSGREIDLSPMKEGASQARRDTAKLRFAGYLALHNMALSESDEADMRNYLEFSVVDRIQYALSALKIAKERSWQIPPDLDRDIQHWLGICLPLKMEDTKPTDIWEPFELSGV